MMPMDGTEVMNRGISLSFGRASNRHCSRLTLEIGTIKRTTASVTQYEEEASNGSTQIYNNTSIISIIIFCIFFLIACR